MPPEAHPCKKRRKEEKKREEKGREGKRGEGKRGEEMVTLDKTRVEIKEEVVDTSRYKLTKFTNIVNL